MAACRSTVGAAVPVFSYRASGSGAILVFTLSAFGKWLPSNGHWFVILAIFGGAGFVIGYLTPTPPVPGEKGEEEEDEVDEAGAEHVSEISA